MGTGPRGPVMIDTLRLTAEDAAGLIERGEVSAAELHRAYLDAIAERDSELHAYLTTVDEPEGDGVPIALKDVISTKGVETTAGSKILAGYIPVADSTVAARCREAGLPLIGKTNMDEFAMGSSTENSAYGPSHNPWDPERVPGGSSGGSAAAVAGGLAPWALGSDTGGSIKQPAALCGLVGLRPTYGTVSRAGIVAFASSLDQVGPITKTVRDCARLYGIIAGRDPADSTTVELPEPVAIPEAEDLKGLKVGVPKELNEAEGIEPGVSEAVNRDDRALPRARRRGGGDDPPALGRVRAALLLPDRPVGGLVQPRPLRRRPLRARASATETSGRCTRRRATKASETSPSAGSCSAPTRSRPGYYDAYYGQAQKVRTIIRDEFAAALDQFDLLVSPTSPTVAFPLGAKTDNPLAMYLSDVLAIPPNMAGLPGLSIPCGLSEGLPVGLQLIGPQFSENLLFRAGHALENALEFDYVPERLR